MGRIQTQEDVMSELKAIRDEVQREADGYSAKVCNEKIVEGLEIALGIIDSRIKEIEREEPEEDIER